MNTLLTGFSSFLDIVDNPTERLVRHFERHGAPGHSLTTCVLPVSYGRAPALLTEAIDRGDAQGRSFDLVWMLGVASASATWRVERFGRNVNAAVPDADDFRPPPCIDPTGPWMIDVTVPVDRLVAVLSQAGLPAAPSDSAGAYLCNHALYSALMHCRQSDRTVLTGFLHVPADPDTFRAGSAAGPYFTFAQHVRAVEITLAALAAQGNL